MWDGDKINPMSERMTLMVLSPLCGMETCVGRRWFCEFLLVLSPLCGMETLNVGGVENKLDLF